MIGQKCLMLFYLLVEISKYHSAVQYIVHLRGIQYILDFCSIHNVGFTFTLIESHVMRK